MADGYIGQRFGKLVVTEYLGTVTDSSGWQRKQYLCKCDCGKERKALLKDLKSGHVASCGCSQGDRGDMVGKVFGRLTVIEYAGITRNPKTKHTSRTWKCKCSCGNITIKTTAGLRSGNINSCGCYQLESMRKNAIKHGFSHTRIYEIWLGMKARCYKPTVKYYYNYGGRGIKVCDEWLESFENFKAWADKSGYADNLTIERKDNDGNYCPENCTWITQAEQNRNRRTSHFVTYKGQKMLLQEIAKSTGIAPQTIKKYEQQYNYDYDLMVKEILESPHHELGKRGKGHGRNKNNGINV
jgi:hypothetical protein